MNTNDVKTIKKGILGAFIVVFAMILIFGSFRTINSGEVGIRV